MLRAHGVLGSMSRKGDCWDNAVVESFFGSLTQERVQWQSYQTRWEARQDIPQYIAVFYNGYRMHSTLNHVSPNAYERQCHDAKCRLTECPKKLDHVTSNSSPLILLIAHPIYSFDDLCSL